MRGIGDVARASGLAISALRFYDQAGVLVPAEVDGVTGYRRYTDDQVRAARLIAGLRRVGLPVAEIAAAVREIKDPDAVRDRLHRHRQRLEDGLSDAKRELLRIHALLDLEENLMTRITLPAAALAASLDAVRFATNENAEALAGVLFETGDGVLTLVATDRYRIARAEAAADVEGPPVRRFLPLTFVDQLRKLSGPITLDLSAEAARAEAGNGVVEAKPIAFDFPDHQRLMARAEPATTRVTVDARLRELVATAPGLIQEHDGAAYDVVVLGLDPAGSLRLAAESEWAADADAHVAVHREFLLQALDAGGSGQLVLELDGPIRPLALRAPGGLSLLMPIRR
jgi:DNA polymerase III subunit beta